MVFVVMLAACQGSAAQGPAEMSARAPDGSAAASFWEGGLRLPAGMRSMAIEDHAAWLVTTPFDNASMLLTRMALDGTAVQTVELESKTEHFAGSGVAGDDEGHVWIAFGDNVDRVTAQSLAVQRWRVRATLDEDTATSRPIVADAWDMANHRLVYVRYGDHVLYGFEPLTGESSKIADLPIVTSPKSQLAIHNGIVVVTGGEEDQPTYVPAGVSLDLTTAISTKVSNILSICATSTDIIGLDASGGVTSMTPKSTFKHAQVTPPVGHIPFGCDELGSAFAASFANGVVTVTRVSRGETVVIQAALVETLVSVHGGLNPPVRTWLDPRPVGIIGDGNSSAWLVTESGVQSVSGSSVYPSVIHITFP